MKTILKDYSKAEISEICGVCRKTVYNWTNHDTIPLWAIGMLGYKIRLA